MYNFIDNTICCPICFGGGILVDRSLNDKEKEMLVNLSKADVTEEWDKKTNQKIPGMVVRKLSVKQTGQNPSNQEITLAKKKVKEDFLGFQGGEDSKILRIGGNFEDIGDNEIYNIVILGKEKRYNIDFSKVPCVERKKVNSLIVCPYCGEKVRYVQYGEYEDNGRSFVLSKEDAIKEYLQLEADRQISELKKQNLEMPSQYINPNQVDIVGYLKCLVDVSSGIYLLESRYRELFNNIMSIQNEIHNNSGANEKSLKLDLLFLEQELDETKSLLAEQNSILSQLVETELIYEKYNNPIAWSTFYEYFITGRVDTLVGPNGAYNLYESEVRSNLVISKLDTIIEQLEAIKDNQFAYYSMIKKTNEILEALSEKTSLVIASIEDVGSKADYRLQSEIELQEKSNQILEKIYNTEQGIEYNTRKTAEYAKVSAKGTKALTFLKAFLG